MRARSIKLLSLIFSVLFVICASGCSGEKAKLPYKYNAKLKTNNLISSTAAENSLFLLRWDSERKCVLLEDKADGYLYNDALSRINDFENLENDVKSVIKSSIMIECVDRSSYALKKFYSSDAVESGNFSIRTTDKGIKITYIFDECKISVPVEYILCDEGMEILVEPKNIAESGDKFFLHSICVAPYMCSVPNMTEDAYLFYPSGSGALIYMDRQRDVSLRYLCDVYGRDRMTDLKTWAEESNEESVKLPVYGSKCKEKGIFAVIESGAEMATVVADAFSKNTGLSLIYSEFDIRGEQNVSNNYLTTSENSVKYSDAFALTPIKVKFYALKGESASYVGMAQKYREYLIHNCGLKRIDDKSDLAIKILGGTMIDTNILGIPSRKMYAMTTVSEAQEIVKDINKSTDASLKISLIGYGKTGLETEEIAGGFAISNKLGGLKQFKSLFDFADTIGAEAFADFDILGINKSGNGYSKTFDVAVTTTKQRFYEQKYLLATNNGGKKI